MNYPPIDWDGHASLFYFAGPDRRLLVSGNLRGLIDVLLCLQDYEAYMIETDAGAMWCRRELAVLAERRDRKAP